MAISFRSSIAGWPALLGNDMEAVAKILVKDHSNYVKNRLIRRHVTALFGNGLLTNEGEFGSASAGWLLLSSLLAIACVRQGMVALTSLMLDGSENRPGPAPSSRDDGPDAAHRRKTLFDFEVERDISDMYHALNDLIVEIASRFIRPIVHPRCSPVARPFQVSARDPDGGKGCRTMIAERRATGLANRTDFLSALDGGAGRGRKSHVRLHASRRGDHSSARRA